MAKEVIMKRFITKRSVTKRFISIMAASVLLVGSLTACGSGTTASGNEAQTDGAIQAGNADGTGISGTDGKLSIVTTIFPEYDWVKNVMGDRAGEADITLLLDNGVDLHSFQPTADDIMKISNCDVFIYVGGESDEWVDDALAEAVNKDQVVINLLESLGDSVKAEEIVEGMQAEEEDDEAGEGAESSESEDGEDAEGEEEEEIEYDEHVWLSLRNAETLCGVIADGLSEADPGNADTYKANADSYAAQLKDLDAQYQKTVDEASVKTLLFGDRFPFRYMTDDYGLSYYAAFVGCSAETEASFETIVFLADKTDELKLGSIMTIENSDGKIAETIRDNTAGKDQNILTLDSMQGTTSKDIAAGASYISIMSSNLEVLHEALN